MNLCSEIMPFEALILKCLVQTENRVDIEICDTDLQKFYLFCYQKNIVAYFKNFCRINNLELPNNIEMDITSEETLTKNYNEQYLNEGVKIQSVLQNHNITCLIVKGVATGYYVYDSNWSARNLGDFDLLVSEKDASKAYSILQEELKYIVDDSEERQEAYEQTVQHFSPLYKDGFSIDLHFRLTQSIEPINIDVKEIINSSKILELESGNIRVPNVEWYFLIICHHMWRHQALEFSFQPRQFAEVYTFLKNKQDKLNWNKVKEICEKTNLNIPVYYCLSNCNRIHSLFYGENLISEELANMFKLPSTEDINELRYRKLLTYESFGQWPESIPYEKRLLRVPHDTDIDVHNFISHMYLNQAITSAWKEHCKKFNYNYSTDIIPGKLFDYNLE